jgi:hypothetical protein
MASADYYLCDVCGRKAIYDADWYYRQEDAGEIKIICKTCAETHQIVIQPRAQSSSEGVE